MSSQIVGKILSEQINLNRTEPLSYISVENVNSGGQIELVLGFENKGNVSQTVTILPFANFVNCLKLSGAFWIDNVPTPVPGIAIIEPGKVAQYKYLIKVNEIPVGAPLTDFSFEADWAWS